jgi:chromate transporter
LAAAAAAVVAIAVVQLARNVLRTRSHVAAALVAFALALVLDRFAPAFTWVALAAGGALGSVFGRAPSALPARSPAFSVSRRTATIAGGLFVVLLAGLPLVAVPGTYLETFATFYRAGSLVFGGGHVVLPFLQGIIGSGVSERTFFAGYGATQAMPGPLFTFAAFLGAVTRPLGGVMGALAALAGIFLPSFLLLAAVIPLWSALRQLPRAAETLGGLNAAVAGLLAAVFVDPILTSLVRDPVGIALALFAALTLLWGRFPAWVTVACCALLGVLIRSYALPSSL